MFQDDVRAAIHVNGTAEPGFLDVVHDAVRLLWERVPDVPRGDRLRFETAVVEVATNVVRHSVPVHEVVQVAADFSVTTTALQATMTDDGASADVDLTPTAPPDTADSGRGLMLIQRTVDTFSFDREADRNVWRLARRYPHH